MSEAKIRSSMPLNAYLFISRVYLSHDGKYIVLCCNMSVPSVYDTAYSLLAQARIRRVESVSSLANVGWMNGRPLVGKWLV